MKKIIIIFLCVIACIVGIYAIAVSPIISTQHFDATEHREENYHAGMYYFDNTDFFRKSVDTFAKTKPLSEKPRIFIVNQHILAAHVIAEQFAQVADPSVKNVVLVTQNNWTAGNSPIITSQYKWRTTLGDILPAHTIVNKLVADGVANVDEEIFNTEHGITGIVPYVAHSFPGAKIVPVVIRDDAPQNMINGLVETLSGLTMSETVIIGSIDGSHYLPKYVSDIHDRLTVQAIQNFEYSTLSRLDIDTVPTLYVVLKLAEKKGLKSFVQTAGVNSAEITNDPELMETTSYISGYFSSTSYPKNPSAIHMLFFGDMMLDRGVALHSEKYGINSLFGKVERLFLGTHAVIGNLEGTITNNESLARQNNGILRFTFKPSFTDLLKKLKITAVSLANNHSADFGSKGFLETQKNLDERGIFHFGSASNDTRLSSVLRLNDKEICLVGYHDLYTYNPTPVIKEIQNIRTQCSFIVVMPHWGVEYTHVPNDRQRKIAHAFIDAGVDVVMGAHPHVVQPVEIYKNKAIFYSLGNFMFDQDFSYETRQGLTVHIELSDDQTRFNLIPTTLTKAEATIAQPGDRDSTLVIVAQSDLPTEIKSDILKTKSFILWNKNQIQE